MSADTINQTGYVSQLPVCERDVSFEVNSDFSLPDYQPEIRRLLSTRVSVLPPSEYVGNDSAEFSGEISYHILYVGSDGALYSTTLSDRYGFSCPLEFSSKSANVDEVSVLAPTLSESVVTRVLAPRKINVRCKLHADVLSLSPALCTPKLTGSVNEECIQNLLASAPVRVIKKVTDKPLTLSDFIALESPTESARIIDCTPSVFMSEVSSGAGKISCKGEVWLKILYCNESESELPLTLTRKVPFSLSLEDEDIDSSYECRAQGTVTEEKFDIEENGINCEFALSVWAEAQKNEQLTYIKDFYSTECECECEYQSTHLPIAIKCTGGNITQNEAVDLVEIKLSPDAKIIDVCGTAQTNELLSEAGKLILKGEAHYRVIYIHEDEYGAQDVTLPFKYELDNRHSAESDMPPVWCASASVISTRARCDEERLYLDSELALTLRAGGKKSVDMLSEATFGKQIVKPKSEIVICYPEKNASLWEIAKKYNEKPEKIRAQNAISEPDQALKKKYLII